MESELFTLPQAELMLKLHEYTSTLDDEEKTLIEERLSNTIKEILPVLSDEELQVIKDEQDRLVQYNKQRTEAEDFLRESEKLLSENYSCDYIKGLEVGDTYFS